MAFAFSDLAEKNQVRECARAVLCAPLPCVSAMWASWCVGCCHANQEVLSCKSAEEGRCNVNQWRMAGVRTAGSLRTVGTPLFSDVACYK
jgi:hypothetical protein